MSHCRHCDGVIQMFGYDDGTYELRCLLCGRSNDPPVVVVPINDRRGPGPGQPDRRYRFRRKEWNRPKTAIEIDYRRCIQTLGQYEHPFYARDLARDLGLSVTIVSHLLKRAEKDGRVRVTGMPTVNRLSGAGTTKPLVWETVHGEREATG